MSRNNSEINLESLHSKEKPTLTPSQALESLPTLASISYLHNAKLTLSELKKGFDLSDATKIDTAVIDYLFATHYLEQPSPGYLVTSKDHPLAEIESDLLSTTFTNLNLLGALVHPKSPATLTDLDHFFNSLTLTDSQYLNAAYLTPLLGFFFRKANAANLSPQAYLDSQVLSTPDSSILAYLKSINFLTKDLQSSVLGQILFLRQPLPGFVQLSHSYPDYYLNLNRLAKNPSLAGFAKEIDRWQPDNALASNWLIKNSAPKIAAKLVGFDTILDFGSGGGHFLHELRDSAHHLIGFDLSEDANNEAKALFDDNGNSHMLTTIHGNLLSSPDLAAAASHQPQAATINYILHDIAGIATHREAGIQIVRNFLANFRYFFPNAPLFISESYDTDRYQQRADDNSAAAVFHFIHGISPQFLLDREELISLLHQTGFQVDETEEIVHRLHKDGSVANSTLIAR